MSDYKRLTGQKWTDDIDLTKEYGYSYIYKRLYELEDKIMNGTLVELPCKGIEELDIIKKGMIFIFYKMCLEQNLGQGVFLEYKSKINEWFKNYLKKTKNYRRKRNERVQEINKQ